MRLLLAVIWAASLALAAPAAAQSSPTQADEEAAKAHFLAGSAYYEQANYTDAVKEFNEAHRLSQRPDLLYNISVCYERLSRWDEAIASLQQYLTERPDAPDRAVIESRIKNFEDWRTAEQQRKAIAAATPPPAPSGPALTTPPSRTRHVVSFVVGGVGAGLLLGAIGTGVAAQLAYDDLNKKCPNKVCDAGNQTLRDQQSSGKALALTTDVLIGVGAAAVVVGTVLFILESRRPAAHARLSPSGSGAVVHF